MIKSKNVTAGWSILLLAVFLISKEFYVMNEESLIVITFTLFIYFTYDAISGIISEMLDERSDLIAKEFNLFFEAREAALKVMISYHEKQASIYEKMQNFIQYLNSKLLSSLEQKKLRLRTTIWNQQYHKLNTLLQRENSMLREIQDATSSKFADAVRRPFKQNDSRGRLFKEIALEEAIQVVGTLSNFQLRNSDLSKLLVLKELTKAPWETILIGYLKTK